MLVPDPAANSTNASFITPSFRIIIHSIRSFVCLAFIHSQLAHDASSMQIPVPHHPTQSKQYAALKAKSTLRATSKYRNHELHAMNGLGVSELGLGFKSSEFSLHRDLGSNFLHLRVFQFLPTCKTHLQVLDGADFLL